MASGPITSWQIDGERVETVTDFAPSTQMVTAAMKKKKKKKKLTPWKKSYDQPRQHIKNQRHYFATKVCIFKAMIFPVVMYGCESWTVKKAEI